MEEKRSDLKKVSTADEQYPKVLSLRNGKKCSKDLIEDLRNVSDPSFDPSTVNWTLIGNSLSGRVAVKKAILREGKQGTAVKISGNSDLVKIDEILNTQKVQSGFDP